MDKIRLYQEYRLIERGETEISGAWKGVHLILFFLAFVFGCSCTFSFHLLMYLFDEKCVLFPKLLSLREMHQSSSVIYDFMPVKNDDSLPVDFVSTQWTDSSTCYLPTYVPLVSGIFGLVWTTMFLMCSSGNRTMTGLQRPWRILLPVFVFSIFMGGLSVYTSYVTHSGLQDLCEKLSEITGSKTCAYTVNIVTLAYERRIRGVYQATRLTILTAWMHTFCWLLAAAVALARVLLVVDFRLVRIQAELQGNIEEMLEHYEQHIRTISPETLNKDDATSTRADTLPAYTAMSSSKAVTPAIHHPIKRRESNESVKVRFLNKAFSTDSETKIEMDELHYISRQRESRSRSSLVPVEAHKLARLRAYRSVTKDNRFIAKMVFDLLDRIDYTLMDDISSASNISLFNVVVDDSITHIARQPGKIASLVLDPQSPPSSRQKSSITSLHQETSPVSTALESSDTSATATPTKQHTLGRSTIEKLSNQKRLTITDSRESLQPHKLQRKDTFPQKRREEMHKELTKRLNNLQSQRGTGTIVVPRTSSNRNRQGSSRPKVTQSARLPAKSSARLAEPKTSTSSETTPDAKGVLENAIASRKKSSGRIKWKERAIQTESVPSKPSPVTLRPENSSELTSYSPSEKTLTPQMEDDNISDRTDSKLSRRRVRLLDDQEPGPSRSREKKDGESQTDKKEKLD